MLLLKRWSVIGGLHFPCEVQSTCTLPISSDETILLQLGSHAQYNLIYVISKTRFDTISYMFKEKVDEDFYINFESATLFSAQVYLNGSPSSGQMVFNTDNFLLTGTDGWTADEVISKGTLARNSGSALVIKVTNPNAEEQTVRISFR